MRNKLVREDSERVIAPADKEARVRFWLDHGNHCLLSHGKPHLHWRHHDGHYWIEEREETFREITRRREAA